MATPGLLICFNPNLIYKMIYMRGKVKCLVQARHSTDPIAVLISGLSDRISTSDFLYCSGVLLNANWSKYLVVLPVFLLNFLFLLI